MNLLLVNRSMLMCGICTGYRVVWYRWKEIEALCTASWSAWHANVNKNLTAAICDHYLVAVPAVRHRYSGREARALAEFSGKYYCKLACWLLASR